MNLYPLNIHMIAKNKINKKSFKEFHFYQQKHVRSFKYQDNIYNIYYILNILYASIMTNIY